MRFPQAAILVLAATSLTACKVGPNFVAPNEPVPDHYSEVIDNLKDRSAPRMSPESPPASFWWRQFHDTDLDRLEERAAAGNLDLKAAYLRIVEARIQVQAARAQGLPSLNGTASYMREQLGLAGIVKSQGIDSGATSPSTQALIGSLEKPVNIYQLGFDASWELDLFGKVRRSVEAADAQSAGAVESRNDLLVSLQAEVAQTYFQLRAGQTLRQITLELISAQHDVFDLTRNRQQHGLANESDVESAQAQLSSLQSGLPSYDQTIATSRHALAVLTGQAPEALDGEFSSAGALPPLPTVIPVGLPSTLARRRPDIRNSEAALHAATAQVGVSVASMFPDISLTGTFGLRNLSTRYLFDWDSKFYTFGPSISVPIFHGGALVASVRLSRAQAAEATLNYRKTVLSALQEVEDGLTDLNEDARRATSLKETVAADQRALEVDLSSYQHGLITYISVLSVQLQEVQARQQLAQAQLTQSTDIVKLYKALGGGWTDVPAPPAADAGGGSR
jgi:NodT family efflux transporter outer membrane factor (OMF) lipoprotein